MPCMSVHFFQRCNISICATCYVLFPAEKVSVLDALNLWREKSAKKFSAVKPKQTSIQTWACLWRIRLPKKFRNPKYIFGEGGKDIRLVAAKKNLFLHQIEQGRNLFLLVTYVPKGKNFESDNLHLQRWCKSMPMCADICRSILVDSWLFLFGLPFDLVDLNCLVSLQIYWFRFSFPVLYSYRVWERMTRAWFACLFPARKSTWNKLLKNTSRFTTKHLKVK